MNKSIQEYLEAFENKPVTERKAIERAKRQDMAIMAKIDGTVVEEVQKILDKVSMDWILIILDDLIIVKGKKIIRQMCGRL